MGVGGDAGGPQVGGGDLEPRHPGQCWGVQAGDEAALRSEVIEYWFGSQPFGYAEGEEFAVEYVYAALGEFVAIGKRPTIIQWIPVAEVPDHRRPAAESADPNSQKWGAALPATGT
ncbi:hypothetical protein [Amycolatopsis sp. SID8362]|uniref:hypothetical protein n=1 Tax=Amycolatopsis sp. SID8362 TaxID=2690346 RepID=UPI00137019BC|nr:hypothetical protein [Amycolatopsis sp. SID8362]NBH11003.1 hypothetical protein [Amycolatopsis sp. SID8362]NED47694.1 hypothetical protein [Amycolatopsis sp. SID8362]